MNLTPNTLDSWINALDESQVEARLAEINETVGQLETERALLTQALNLQRQWRERSVGWEDEQGPDTRKPMVPVPAAHLGLSGPVPSGKVEAALRVLGAAPDREWTSRDVGDQLIELGWMQDSQKDHDSLASTLSRLAKERKIHRPRRGVYRLGPTEDASVA